MYNLGGFLSTTPPMSHHLPPFFCIISLEDLEDVALETVPRTKSAEASRHSVDPRFAFASFHFAFAYSPCLSSFDFMRDYVVPSSCQVVLSSTCCLSYVKDALLGVFDL